MNELKLRASYAPTVHACGQSWRGDDGIDPTHEYSKLGTAVHDALAKMVQDQHVDLNDIALLHGVDEDALATAYGYGVSAWNNPAWPLKTYFPRAQAEQKGALTIHGDNYTITMSGHVDVVDAIWTVVSHTYILDWKLGNISRAYWQMVIYAACWVVVAKDSRCTAILVNLMDGKARIINFMWDSDDLNQIDDNGESVRTGLLKELYDRAMDVTYRPSMEACLYCKRRFTCEAQKTSLAAPGEARAATKPDMPIRIQEIIDGGHYPEFRDFRKGLKRVIEDCEKSEKEIIRAQGEIVSGGKRYTIEEGVARREVNISDVGVWKYLREKLGSLDELRKTIGYVSLKSILSVISKNAEHGKKGKAKQIAQAELEELGGLAVSLKYTVVEEDLTEKGDDDERRKLGVG